MTGSLGGTSSCLWVCHDCKMVGTEAEARAHHIAKGHEPVVLTEDESAAVRTLWNEERAKRVAGFMLAAKGRGPFAGLADSLPHDQDGDTT